MGAAVVGVDPGGSGACVYVSPNRRLLLVKDMPIVNGHLHPALCQELVFPEVFAESRVDIVAAFVEKVHSMPGQGVASMFKQGANWGGVRALFGAWYPLEEPTPQEWKKALGIKTSPRDLPKARKKAYQEDQARELVLSWWPEAAELFTLKKWGGRCEAGCIAEFGRRQRIERGLEF